MEHEKIENKYFKKNAFELKLYLDKKKRKKRKQVLLNSFPL